MTTDIAHTGIESERDFRKAVIRYRGQYADYLDDLISNTGGYRGLYSIDRDDVPAFEYREITASQALATHLPYFTVLLLYSMLFFLCAQIAFLRSQL